MRTLNDVVGSDEPRVDEDWTPAIGLRRGRRRGLIGAVVLALLLVPLAAYVPYVLITLWLRVPLAFALGWLLCGVVQRGAGMVAGRCIALGIVLAGLVLVSNHAVFALHGVPASGDYADWWTFPASMVEGLFPPQTHVLSGGLWFHPYALLLLNGPALLFGGGFAALLASKA